MSARVLVWVAVLVAGVWFMTLGGGYPGQRSADVQLVSLVVAVTVLGCWLLAATFRPRWRPETPLLVPIAVAAGAYGVSFLFSARPRLSLEPTVAGLGYFLTLLFLITLLRDEWIRRRLDAALVGGVTLIAGSYVVDVVREWSVWWDLVGRVTLPPLRPGFVGGAFGGPNQVATVLILLGPVAVARVAVGAARWLPAIALALLVLVALVLTGSRGGMLGVAAGLGLGLALVATRSEARLAAASISQRVPRPVFLLAGAGLLTLGAVIAPAIAYRLGQGGEALRIDLWRASAGIFVDHPITGGGPGTWAQLKVFESPAGSPNVIVPTAHNLYVQTAAELGIVGLAAGTVFVGALGRRLLKATRVSGAGLTAGAILVAFAGFGAQSLVDTPINLPVLCLPLILLVAVADRLPSSSGKGKAAERQVTIPAIAPLAAFAVLLVALPHLWQVQAARFEAEAGDRAALDQDWPAALAHYDAANRHDEDFTLYRLQRASALAHLGRTGEARAELTTAVGQDGVGVNLVSLGVLELADGDATSARNHIEAALEIAPGEPVIALNAGIVAEALHQPGAATDHYAVAVALAPSIAGSDFWTTPERIVQKSLILEAARAKSDPLSAALIRAYGGDPVGGRAEAEAQPASTRREVVIAAANAMTGDVAAARGRLSVLLQRSPSDWYAAGWLARIERLWGDPALSGRYGSWARAVQADSADGAILEPTIDTEGEPAASLPLNYPWAVYTRQVSPFLIAPQVALVGTR